MIFVDTNYFLRFLLKDNSNQFEIAKNLFEEAAYGKVALLSSVIVFFEIYWVLDSFYKHSKTDIIVTLKKILGLTFIGIENRAILERSVKLFANTNLSLEDCYNLEFSKTNKVTEIKSFDRKLLKQYKALT